MRRFVVALAFVTLSCGEARSTGPQSGDAAQVATGARVAPSQAPEAEASAPPPALSPLAALVTEAENARYDAALHTEPVAPAALSVPSLGVFDASVMPVGLDPDGELDVPGADLVGWYRYGASPGSPGSSVLASHVEYNNVPGVFRYLTKLKVGDLLTVGFVDGSSRQFRVAETAMYDKSELPEQIWRRTGASSLALVTCGGNYNRSEQSYESNVVVYTVPV